MFGKHVSDLMEENPVCISPDATLSEAAQMMKDVDCGFLPIGTVNDPVGILTDRDIVIRAIAEGKDPAKEKVRDYMTTDVCSCKESDTLTDAADIMNTKVVSRLIVQGEDGKMCGVLTFGRIIRAHEDRTEVSDVVNTATARVDREAAA